MASENIVELSSETFEQQVTGSDVPVLVDFWAEWCGPCRMVAPTLEKLATKYDGKVKIVKLNVDHAQDVAIRFGVQSIPTFILFKNGEIADRTMGAQPQAAFEQMIERNV